MLFNSIHFLFFFVIVMAMYFAIPYRFRWILLLGASYYFYMSFKTRLHCLNYHFNFDQLLCWPSNG